MTRSIAALFSCAILFISPQATPAATIPTVPIGNPGNAPDPLTGRGAVGYRYRIGATEVTNAQYAEFLNAKAADGSLGLYNLNMGRLTGGITGTGPTSYATIPGRENKPVEWVSWYDAIRFVNWLHNGKGDGDTETGAYTLLGARPIPFNPSGIARNPGARWFLPTVDEWYKAAYHQDDGPTGNYFDYSTGSDTAPVAEAPAGGSNSANYDFVVGDYTDAGAYTGSASPYGTFDQAGNAREWVDGLISSQFNEF